MSFPAEREQLLMRYLDGRLSPAESGELGAWLCVDAAARAWLREMAEQVVALGDMGREKSWRTPVAESPAQHTGQPVSPRFPRATWLALAASMVLLAGAVWLWLGERSAAVRAIVEVEEVAGALNWTGANGAWRVGLAAGARLPAGILETEGEDATALVRFADGTRLTLRGSTQVALSDDRQKRASLLSGTLEANVRPQPKPRPLVIRTPTARLEVLGTVFSVTAAPDQTTMSVEQGRVRVQRFADGQSVDVPANHTIIASLETTGPLVFRPAVLPSAAWSADFRQAPTAGSKFEWLPATAKRPAIAQAVPLVVGKRHDGGPLIQYGVSLRDSTRRPSGSFVAVTSAKHPGLPGFKNSIFLDQFLIEKLAPDTRYPSLILNVGGNDSMSWTSNGVNLPAKSSPSKVFGLLFGKGTPTELQNQTRDLKRGQSILDTVNGEAKKLHQDLGPRDREKLDQYLTSVRDLELRLQSSEKWVQRPKPVVDAKWPTDIQDRTDIIARTRLMHDLMVLALQTDSTRFITYKAGGMNAVPKIEGVDQDWHNLSHHGQEAAKIDELRLIELAEFREISRLLGLLKGVKEGNRTLLDQTVVMAGSNLGNASSHSWRDLPVVLAGGGFKHGQHLNAGGAGLGNARFGNLFVQVSQRMGVETERFGTSNGTSVKGLEMV